MSNVFDFSGVDAKGNDYDLIPPGVYKMICEKAEWREARTQGNEYINAQFRITGAKQNNRVLFGIYNLINSNETARNIAMSNIKAMLIAMGADADKLKTVGKNDIIDMILNRPFNGKVAIKKDRNELVDYLPLDENNPFGNDVPADSPF